MNLTFILKKWLKSLLGTLFTKYVGPSARAVLVDLGDSKYLVPSSDLSFARSLGLSKGYNKPLVDFLKTRLTEKSSALFIGTHIGTVLIPIAKKCESVIGIEANPSTFKILESNLLLNDVHNVELINRAAYDQKTELSFLAMLDNTGGSKVVTGKEDLFFHLDPSNKIIVPGDKVDDLISKRNFDLIVMDIEGSEQKALRGMPEILKNSTHLVLEIHPLSIEKLTKISPQDFFNAIPDSFINAIPINATTLKQSYSRQEFLSLYAEISNSAWMTGIDVLFTKK